MVAIGEGPETKALLDFVRPMFALYVGGMGARGKNFYNDLACHYGYEKEAKEIQDLYLAGKKKEAEALVPTEWLEAANLVGPASYVKERIAAFEEAGVTNLQISPRRDDPAATVAQVKEWVADDRPSSIFEQEHEDFRATARAFFEREVVPHHDQWEHDGIVDREVWRKAGEAGCSASTSTRSTAAPGIKDFRYNVVLAEEIDPRRRQRPRVRGAQRHHRPLHLRARHDGAEAALAARLRRPATSSPRSR